MSRLSSKRIPVHSSSRRDAERSRFQGSSKGQEANAVGFILALREDDWLIPAFRELGAFAVRFLDSFIDLVTQPIRILDSPLGNEKFLQTHLNRPELRSLE